MALVSQADFARLHQVSRKTVTTWKQRGYIELFDKLVDVERSNARLAGFGRAWPKVVTGVADRVVGNTTKVTVGGNNAGPNELWETAGPHFDRVLDVSGMINPWLVSELILRHLPQAVVRPSVAEYVARSRRGASELLLEEGIHGCSSGGRAAEGGDVAAVHAVASWFGVHPDQVTDAVTDEGAWATKQAS